MPSLTPRERALLSLDGLSMGDAFGENFSGEITEVLPRIGRPELPETVWPYTDDTEMALSVVGDDQKRLYEQVARILGSLDPSLQHGGRVDRVFGDEHAAMYCVSFGVTYVLGLWMMPDTNDFAIRRAVRAALPIIESLTLSLPPPDGSGGSSGAQHA